MRYLQQNQDNVVRLRPASRPASATLAVYLDVYNVFVSLLNLLMAFSGERD